MRISDWSSDVCSSDLGIGVGGRLLRQIGHDRQHILGNDGIDVAKVQDREMPALVAIPPGQQKIRDLGRRAGLGRARGRQRSEEHTSELPSLMRISYAVFC